MTFAALLISPLTRCHAAAISEEELLGHVRHLASDELSGRGTGTEGCIKAADYIARAFESAGLRPLPGLDGFRQEFQTPVAASLGPGNRISVPGWDGQSHPLKVEEDYIPFAFSGTAGASSPVVFAGYGITAPEYSYDDYASVDVAGKIVLVLRHEPREDDPESPFEGRADTRHAEFRVKARNAANHGAAGLMVVDDPLNHEPEDETLVPFGRGVGPEGTVAIPVVHLRRAVVESFWGVGMPGRFRSLESVQAGIDSTLQPHSFEATALPVSVTTDIVVERPFTANVVGYLPPSAETRSSSRPSSHGEHIILGAHYDHLGLGGTSSLAPDRIEIHNGADDNASGTAALIGLARALARDPAPRERGVVFAAFSGEELGLRGSAWYVDHPPLPLGDAVAMLNMDMIGRLREGRIHIGGVGTSTAFRPLLEDGLAATGLKAEYSEGGYGPSDHTSFYGRQVPVLFFFTGAHEDYHKPSDDWERINAPGLGQVTELVLRVSKGLIESAPAVPFIQVAEDSSRRAYGGRGSSGAWLGTIPDYGGEIDGVKLTGVREGGPADAAGIRGGDIIVGLGGQDIHNIYDLTDELRAHRPGDQVEVIVLRDGRKVVLPVVLGKRE